MTKSINSRLYGAYQSWLNAGDKTDIYDAYKCPSRRKINAWRYCQELCESYNGYGLRIIGHNSQTFSVGFEYMDEKSGLAMFVWHTAYNTYSGEIRAEWFI